MARIGRLRFANPLYGLVYTSGKRAILALEKGTPGQRAFEEAFRAWGE